MTGGQLSITPERPIASSAMKALFILLAVASIGGLANYPEFSSVPTTALLDAWVALLLVSSLGKGWAPWPLATTSLLMFLAVRLLIAYSNDDPMWDALQAHRWLIYLTAITIAIGRSRPSQEILARITNLVLGAALLKSLAITAQYGLGERPGLLIENNFEVALFCGLACLIYRQASAIQRAWLIAALTTIVVLAGSRSGAISLIIFLAYAVTQARVGVSARAIVAIYTIPIAAYVPYMIFAFRSRTDRSAQLDRLNFLDVFRAEVANWSALNWIFGTEPITPLQAGSCRRLDFYENLFSSAGDGSCYSVILHAFVLRVVFDAGLIGLAIAITVPAIAMRKAGVRTSLWASLLGIAWANGLSVSGINSPYVALPILLALLSTTPDGPFKDPNTAGPVKGASVPGVTAMRGFQ